MTPVTPIAVLVKSGRTHRYDAWVERAFDLINPDPKHATQCRVDIATTISLLDCQPPFVPPNVVRRQLENIAAKLQAAQTAIGELTPSKWQAALLHSKDLVGEIERARVRASELAADITPAKRSGGGRNKREEAMRKLLAADRAFDLLIFYGHSTPTATRKGKYVRLATLLCEGATLQKMNLERACADVIRLRRQLLKKIGQPQNSVFLDAVVR
jgi:hypothetical protein